MIKDLIVLKDTEKLMKGGDYRDRFVAEYIQLAIRYERLKAFNTRISAANLTLGEKREIEMPTHDCPSDLLTEQQSVMGNLLRILETRAVIEDIDLADAIASIACEKIADRFRKKDKHTKSVCAPPIKIGDKVHYIEKDEDNVTTYHPYTVCGVAFLDGKWYAIDKNKEFNEVNTEWCVLGYRGTEIPDEM